MGRWIGILALTLGLAAFGLTASPALAADEAKPAASQPAKAQVNVNTADVAELKKLHGIGDSLAKAIVEYRKEHGPFQKVDDLAKVKGIGDKKLAAIRGQVTVK